MTKLYAVWLPPGAGDRLARMPELAANGHSVEVAGERLMIMDRAVLTMLRGLDKKTDGHYDGHRVRVDGEGYLVVDHRHSQRMHAEHGSRLTAEQHQIIYERAWQISGDGDGRDHLTEVECTYEEIMEMLCQLRVFG